MTGEVKSTKRFVDLLGRVFGCHSEAYAAGSVGHGRWADCGGVDAVCEQSLGERRCSGRVTDQDRQNRTDGLRHPKTELLHSIEQPLSIRPEPHPTCWFTLNDGDCR